MSTANLSVRIDSKLKKEVENCLDELGMNMSTAIIVYLKQIVKQRAIPFRITAQPHVNRETVEAIAEGRRIADDPAVPAYHDMKSLFEALDS